MPYTTESENATVRVLAVMAAEHDHETLDRILRSSKWNVVKAANLAAALAQLEKLECTPVVLCDRELAASGWKEVLRRALDMTDGPEVIVSARLADEKLWAEALNLGAYDVLAKPFDATEVERSLSAALRCWRARRQVVSNSTTNSWVSLETRPVTSS